MKSQRSHLYYTSRKPSAPRSSSSPLCKALPSRTTPELQYLQAKWAAYLPYRQATALLKEVLPLGKAISHSSTRRTVRSVGKALDAEIECEIAWRPKTVAGDQIRQSASVASVCVDSAWIGHHSSPKGRDAARARALLCSPLSRPSIQERHVNIVAGRATFVGRAPRVYAYVHKEVPSAAARLDQFLARHGVEPNERVSVISDDAGEFVKAGAGSQLARGRILDWFHIAMKFKAAENSVFGSAVIEPLERTVVMNEIRSAKWLAWHGKGGKSVARIKALDDALMARKGYEYSTLWWNLQRASGYIKNNAATLVNYGARYRKGLPISSSIAESAVNLVVSHRMAKKQHMRWTDEGAQCLVQVRVAALNGELSPSRLSALARASQATSKRACHLAKAAHRAS
ncbi:ISKra4 family transposase [Variovorax sp. J22R133]|uniref:ISKra4 family transposase n=1 Tax=Variovorax brevis TaxID=3053503 RepID=UPI0025781C37|nr:ISKra4 family transposase [Variovorax sp. J22R133]MDM0118116.1 ISKra4 family transposase [Variovorax sp. J22R133]